MEQACCGTHAQIVHLAQRTVNEGINNVRRGKQLGSISYHGVDHAEVAAEDIAHAHDGQNHNSGLQQRQGNMTNLLKASCTIHTGSLIHTGVKAGDCCDIGHRTEAASLPNAQYNED